MSPQQLLESLNWRYATKTFKSNKKIDSSTWKAIEDSLVLTPSSFGLQPWKFIVITNQEKKEALLEHSWNQRQVVDCSHLVVLCAQTSVTESHIEKIIDRIIELRGGEKESLQMLHDMMKGFISQMDQQQLSNWTKSQTYIALGQLMTAAAALKIDACPMEGIIPSEYDRILGLEGTNYATTLACPLGFRSDEDKYASAPKVRYDKSEIISHL